MHLALVTVHYQQAHLTQRCLQSLLMHLRGDYQIYVVDNASGNGSLEALQAQFTDPRLHWLPQTQNLGFGEGCNVGIQAALAAGAEAVILINNDAWIEADILAAFDAGARHYGPKALLTGCIVEPDGRPWYQGGGFSLWRVRTWHQLSPLQRDRQVGFISGCLMYLPLAALQGLQGFDPRYFLYLEDLELCLRARQQGCPLICLAEVQIRHQPSSSTGGRHSGQSIYYQNRNRWLLLASHGQRRHWPVFLAGYALGLLRRCLQSTTSCQASLQALCDALRQRWGARQSKF